MPAYRGSSDQRGYLLPVPYAVYRGEVLKVDRVRGVVLIKEVNMVQRHTKPRRQGQQGGILPMEAPIHLSNVLKYCDSCGRGVRKLCEKPAWIERDGEPA